MTQPLIPDRLKASLSKIVNGSLLKDLIFLAEWEYQVASVTLGPPVKIDCVAIDPSTLEFLPPTQQGITLWPGPSGFVAVPPPGSIVRIGFANGDSTKPMVRGLDPNATNVLVYAFGTEVQIGDATATFLAKAAPLTTFLGALQTWSAAVAAALSSAGFPIVAAQAALVSAISTAISATPCTKVSGT